MPRFLLFGLIQSILFTLAPPATADGPSFNCKKASTPVERTICDNPLLSDQDLQLTAAYKEAKAVGSHLVDAQRDWLKSRETCGSDFVCIYERTRERTVKLLSAAFSPDSSKAYSGDIDDTQITDGIQIIQECKGKTNSFAFQCNNGKEIGFSSCKLGHTIHSFLSNLNSDGAALTLNKMCEWSGNVEIYEISNVNSNGHYELLAYRDNLKAKIEINLLDGVSLTMLEQPKPVQSTSNNSASSADFYNACLGMTQYDSNCYSVKNSDIKNLCLANSGQGYETSCYGIDDPDLKNLCLAKAFPEYKSSCYSIENEDIKNTCLAAANHDYRTNCYSVKSEPWRSFCGGLALSHNNCYNLN